jgi:hypothetical protein
MTTPSLIELWAKASEVEKTAFIRFVQKPRKPSEPNALEKILQSAESAQIKHDKRKRI